MNTTDNTRIKSEKFGILDSVKQKDIDILLSPGYMGRALLFLDIDHFKELNTKYTETKVDKTILPDFYRLLLEIVDPYGYVYLVGGDEMVILLNNCSVDLACVIAENIRNSIEQKEFFIDNNLVHLTVSIGIAHSKNHNAGADLQELANEAENESKRLGRNRTSIALNDKIEPIKLQPLIPSPPPKFVISPAKFQEMVVEEDALISQYINQPSPFYLKFYSAGSWKLNPFFRELSNDPELYAQITSKLLKSSVNEIPKVRRSLILLKALDENGQPCLLQYYSGRKSNGWNTWLLPNFDRDIQTSKEDFVEEMSDYLKVFLGLENEKITIHDLNTLSICVKTNRHAINQEVRIEPKFFAFRYYYATVNFLPKRLLQPSSVIPQGDINRRLKWFYSEELGSGADENKIAESNADVIKTIYDVCGTLLTNIPAVSTGIKIMK